MNPKLIILSCLFLITSQLFAQNTQMWATAEMGGTYAGGTLFSINSDGSDFNVAFNFDSWAGYRPMGNLFFASDSNVYGTCFYGGYLNSCVIYRYSPEFAAYTTLHDFDIVHGDYPTSGMVEENGILYGNTSSGGPDLCGVIYSWNISTGEYYDLHDLSSPFGCSPYSAPIAAADGNLYGTTQYGGAYDAGVIYSFNPSGNVYTDIYDFDSSNESGNPIGSLLQADDGMLYGMCHDGGTYGQGFIYRYDLVNSTFENLHDFDGTNGAHPKGGLIQGSDGIFYGLTTEGGQYNSGTIFSFDPDTYTKLFDFQVSDGVHPQGNLMQAGHLLCGTAYLGGDYNHGTLFNFNMLTDSFTKILDLDMFNTGAQPTGGFITLGNDIASQIHSPGIDEVNIFPNPTCDVTICKTSLYNNEKIRITVCDLSGNQILSQQLEIRNSQAKIDLSNVISGIYFLEISTANQSKILKLVKQ